MSDAAPTMASLLAQSQRLPEYQDPLGLSTPRRVPPAASGPTGGVSVDVPRGSKLYKVVRVDRDSRVCLGQIESQNEQTNEIKYKTKTDAEIKTEEGTELTTQVPEFVAYNIKFDAEIKTEEGTELTTQVPELVAYKTKFDAEIKTEEGTELTTQVSKFVADTDAGLNFLSPLGETWWKWVISGSGLFFWHWPKGHQMKTARDGIHFVVRRTGVTGRTTSNKRAMQSPPAKKLAKTAKNYGHQGV